MSGRHRKRDYSETGPHSLLSVSSNLCDQLGWGQIEGEHQEDAVRQILRSIECPALISEHLEQAINYGSDRVIAAEPPKQQAYKIAQCRE